MRRGMRRRGRRKQPRQRRKGGKKRERQTPLRPSRTTGRWDLPVGTRGKVTLVHLNRDNRSKVDRAMEVQVDRMDSIQTNHALSLLVDRANIMVDHHHNNTEDPKVDISINNKEVHHSKVRTVVDRNRNNLTILLQPNINHHHSNNKGTPTLLGAQDHSGLAMPSRPHRNSGTNRNRHLCPLLRLPKTQNCVICEFYWIFRFSTYKEAQD